MVIAIASLAGPAFVPPRGINMLPAQIGRPAVPMPTGRSFRQLAARSHFPGSETGPIGMPRWRYERHAGPAQALTRVRRTVINPVPDNQVLPPISAELPNQMPRTSRGIPGSDPALASRRPPPEILQHILAQLNYCRSDALSPAGTDACREQGLLSIATNNAETPTTRPSRPTPVPHEQFIHGPVRFRHVHLPKLLQRMQRQLTALQSLMEDGCTSSSPGKEAAPQHSDAHPIPGDRTHAPGFPSPESSRPVKSQDDEEMREWLRNAPDQHQLNGFGVFDDRNQNPAERPATPHHLN